MIQFIFSYDVKIIFYFFDTGKQEKISLIILFFLLILIFIIYLKKLYFYVY